MTSSVGEDTGVSVQVAATCPYKRAELCICRKLVHPWRLQTPTHTRFCLSREIHKVPQLPSRTAEGTAEVKGAKFALATHFLEKGKETRPPLKQFVLLTIQRQDCSLREAWLEAVCSAFVSAYREGLLYVPGKEPALPSPC